MLMRDKLPVKSADMCAFSLVSLTCGTSHAKSLGVMCEGNTLPLMRRLSLKRAGEKLAQMVSRSRALCGMSRRKLAKVAP